MSMRRPPFEYWPMTTPPTRALTVFAMSLHRDADVGRAAAVGGDDELRGAELVVAVDVGHEARTPPRSAFIFVARPTSVFQSLPRTENSTG